MKRVFVTGATGFIGRHLATELADQGCQVRCLVRRDQPPPHLDRQGIECVAGDLHDRNAVASAVRDVDTVFHLAGRTHAMTSSELHLTNSQACGWLAEACLAQPNPPRVVYVSSLAAAGPVARDAPARTEQDACCPVSHYGHSKRGGEIEFQRRADRLACSIVRPGVVLGPHDQGAVPMFRSIYRQRVHLVVGMRTPRLSIIGVGDLVQLLIAAARQGERLVGDAEGGYSSQGYYLACDDRDYPSYSELGRLIAEALDRRVLVWPIWKWVGRGVAMSAQSFNRVRGQSSMLNVDKIREATVGSWACSSQRLVSSSLSRRSNRSNSGFRSLRTGTWKTSGFDRAPWDSMQVAADCMCG